MTRLEMVRRMSLSPLGYIPINYLNYPTNLSLSDSCIYIRSGICWRFFRVIYMQLYQQPIIASIYLLVIYFQRHWNNIQSKSIFVQFHFKSFWFFNFFFSTLFLSQWNEFFYEQEDNPQHKKHRWPSSKSDFFSSIPKHQ